jgi:uncharacterized protein (DUF1015 family)
MSQLVRPFPARLVQQAVAADVVCPMHDALTPERRADLLANQPLSYLQVTRSALDMPHAAEQQIGEANAAGLERLLAAGAYGGLAEPALYVYRVRRGDEDHTGIVGELDVAAFVDGRVLGHESVHAERVAALARHFEAVPTRSELVTVIHRHDDTVAEVVRRTVQGAPLLDVTDVTGVDQRVWRIAPADAGLVVERLAGSRLYIADGHHRVAATVARWREHGSPEGGGVLSVLYAEEQVHLLAFHRRVIGPVPMEETVAGLGERALLTPVDGPQRAPGSVGMRLGRRWFRVELPPMAGFGSAALDVSVLDSEVLDPVLGVTSGHDRVQYVSELNDLDEAVAAVDQDGGALFLLAAPTLDQLVDVAERGDVMPQKSTYIEPKPRAGVFLRPRLAPPPPVHGR